MYCKNCGSPVPESGRFCTRCGTPIEKVKLNSTSTDNHNAVPPLRKPLNSSVSQDPFYQFSPTIPQEQQFHAPEPPKAKKEKKTKKDKKNKEGKKRKSGCLIFLLILLVLAIAVGAIGIFLLGKILPGSNGGNSINQQVQPEYIEPTESTPLRESLGGTYTPDENDFRFDDGDVFSGYVDHVLLVFFKPNVMDDEVRRVAEMVNGELIGCIDSLNCFELRVPVSGKKALDEMCEILIQESSVIRACTDNVDFSSSITWSDPNIEDVVPNDPWGEPSWIPDSIGNVFVQQWSMLFPRGNNWHQELIGAPSAWAYSNYYSNVNVGILDAGFDTEHSDLRITMINPATNKITRDNKKMADNYNHGTHVAGIIGATRGNGVGINGILSGPYSLYGFCRNDVNENWTTRSIDLVGCSMLLQQNCRVINRSMGCDWENVEIDKKIYNFKGKDNIPEDPRTGEQMPDSVLFDKGVNAAKDVLILLEIYGPDFLIVNSAGNNGMDARYNDWVCAITRDCAVRAIEETPDIVGYTADDIMDAVIVVGAIANNKNYGSYSKSDSGKVICDRHLELTDFSNFGSQVTICAPGDYIYSTVRNGYDSKPGTSMASPIVAACAAQLWSIDPYQKPGQIKDRLINTAVSGVETVSAFDRDGATYPMVNLKDAVESLLLEKGLITETRPDGDLKRLTDEYINKKIEEKIEKLESLSISLVNDLENGNFESAFTTAYEMIENAVTMIIYIIFSILAKIVLP